MKRGVAALHSDTDSSADEAKGLAVQSEDLQPDGALRARSDDSVPPDPAGEFPFNTADYLFHLLNAVGRLRESQLEPGLALLDLNMARYRSLAVVGKLGKCTMSELAMFTSIDRTTLTRSVDQLLSAGLVERLKEEGDRRLVLIALTPEGEKMRRKGDAFVSNHGRYLLEGVPEFQQREFVRMQKGLIAKLAPDPLTAQSILEFRGPAAGAVDGDST